MRRSLRRSTGGPLDIQLPAEFVAEVAPLTTPSGKPIPRLPLKVRETSELIVAVAQGRIVQLASTVFAETYRHPGVVFVPISDLPMSKTALAWRRRDRSPGLREFLRVAQAEPPDRTVVPSSGGKPG